MKASSHCPKSYRAVRKALTKTLLKLAARMHNAACRRPHDARAPMPPVTYALVS